MEKQKNSSTECCRSVPQLRFSEFKGEWEAKNMADIAKFSKGKGISKSEITENGKTECVRYGELYTRYGEVINEVYSKTDVDLKNLVLSEANDVIIPASGETQIDIATASCVTKSGIALGGDLNIIKTKNNGVFLSYYLNNRKKIEIANLAQGISVVHLYSSQLAILNLNIPTLPEQTRIAAFFTSIDQKLTQLKQKKALLEQYKKGVMQKIFSQELRFKIANEAGELVEPPEWEKKKFSEYIKLYRGSSPRPINRFTTNELNGINWIKIGDTKNSKNYLIGSVEEKITVEGSKNSRKVIKGELILANSMSFGKTYLLNIDGCIYDGWFVLREFEAFYYRDFLHQLLNSEFLQKQYKTLSTGGVVQNISSEIVYSTILLKPSLLEQTKIANFLTAIDEKINHCQKQIEQTEQWKKGLLQKMFC